MDVKPQKFIVTEQPPWYSTAIHKDVFRCATTKGLFNKVADLMLCKHDELTESEKRYKPKNVNKTIRDMVIRDADVIAQKPSRSLLLALMDLVDIECGNLLQSSISPDKAGVKHLLLSESNYTLFYLPREELVSRTGKAVIPVVTQYAHSYHYVFNDHTRSTIGTYIVSLPPRETLVYFCQEALFIPGLESLKLLEKATGGKYEFWDLALEVPTHATALTPSFRRMEHFQLIRSEGGNHGTENDNGDALSWGARTMNPMCCVPGECLIDPLKKTRKVGVDYFTQDEIICNLSKFHYENSDTPIVYARKLGTLRDGKRVNLVPVVVLENNDTRTGDLYVSTTLRFCRSVKTRKVMGLGEPANCWEETLKDLTRGNFIKGPDMYQEILAPALAAFTKRVNEKSFRNYIPYHLESMITEPVRVEMVELAIKLMDSQMPNAFAVAELLYCPIDTVKKYLRFWRTCLSDNNVNVNAKRMKLCAVKDLMKKEWLALVSLASGYCKKVRWNERNKIMLSKCKDVFLSQTVDVPKAQKVWFQLLKCNLSENHKKDSVQMNAEAKVILLKLRTYQNQLKKDVNAQKGKQTISFSPQSSGVARGADRSPKKQAELIAKRTEYQDGNGDGYSCIGTPEKAPVCDLIKGMGTLLLSEPWLYHENTRRQAVCTLLGLEQTLLHKSHSEILSEWVINNRTIVNNLRRYDLKDNLSKALVDCLESTSPDNWRRGVLSIFLGTQKRPLKEDSGQLSGAWCGKAKRKIGSANTAVPAKKRALPQRPQSVMRDKSFNCEASSSAGDREDKPWWGFGSLSKSSDKNEDEYSNNNDFCSSQAFEAGSEEELSHFDEDEFRKEDLMATMEYDDNESIDDYDYTDPFIDDEDHKPKKKKKKVKNVKGESSENGPVYSDCRSSKRKVCGDTSQVSAEPVMKKSNSIKTTKQNKTKKKDGDACVQKYTRVLLSDSEEDLMIMSPVTLLNPAKENNVRANRDTVCPVTVLKHTPVQSSDQEDDYSEENPAQEPSDSCEKQTFDCHIQKSESLDSESYGQKRAEKQGVGIKADEPSKMTSVHSPVSNSYLKPDKKKDLISKDTQSLTSEQKVKKLTKPDGLVGQRETLARKVSGFNGTAHSPQCVGFTLSEDQSTSGHAAKVRGGSRSGADRRPESSQSDSEDSLQSESEPEWDYNGRLHQRSEKTRYTDPETAKDEYLVYM